MPVYLDRQDNFITNPIDLYGRFFMAISGLLLAVIVVFGCGLCRLFSGSFLF